MRLIILVPLFALLLLSAVTASAQNIEITPFAAYRAGGEFDATDDNFFGTDVEVAESESYGIIVNIPFTRFLQFEIMADHQSSNFEVDGGIFDPTDDLGDVDVNYYHGGLLIQSDHPRVRPFGVISLGFTRIDPDIPGLDSETRFSSSLGGGLKFLLSRNVGIRLEGRGFYTVLDDSDDDDCDFCDYRYEDSLTQTEVRLGLILSF